MDEREERMKATERAYKYYERQGVDAPPTDSQEWREMVSIQLNKIQRGES